MGRELCMGGHTDWLGLGLGLRLGLGLGRTDWLRVAVRHGCEARGAEQGEQHEQAGPEARRHVRDRREGHGLDVVLELASRS